MVLLNMKNIYNLCKCGRKKCELSKKCKECVKVGNHRKLSHIYKFNPSNGEWMNQREFEREKLLNQGEQILKPMKGGQNE